MLPTFNRAPYELAAGQDPELSTKRPFSSTSHSSSRRRRNPLIILGLLVIASLYLWHQQSVRALYARTHDRNGYKLPGEIPNIAHFVRQLNRHKDGSPKPLRFEFRHFLAYYSAHHHLKPDEINIWSDVDTQTLAEARQNGDVYTKAVLSLPKLRFRYVDMPNQTATGFPIERYAHKSDFVRTRVMAEMGGQYFDDDSWVLRDLAVFRKAGFDNVFGREWGDDLCQAMWMSTPNNTLMNVFSQLQETEFNGEWVKASNILLTNLVKDIRGLTHDRHALVLHRDAFFPGEWGRNENGLPMFYQTHREKDETTEPLPPATTAEELVKNYKYERHYGWRKDWRSSYVIHGFSDAVRNEKMPWMFDPYGGFNFDYVMARESNIARALYPALQSALDEGVIKLEDVKPPPPKAQA